MGTSRALTEVPRVIRYRYPHDVSQQLLVTGKLAFYTGIGRRRYRYMLRWLTIGRRVVQAPYGQAVAAPRARRRRSRSRRTPRGGRAAIAGGPLLRNGPHLRPRFLAGGNNERDIRLLPRCSRGSHYLRAKVDAVLDERRPGEQAPGAAITAAPGASLSAITTSNLVDPSRRG